MPHTITNLCTQCGDCLSFCPTGAIKIEAEELWIDPMVCNDCEGYSEQPLCVSVCSTDHPPLPLQAKKGRCKTTIRTLPSPNLFANGRSNSFASAIVVWEACNVLAQRQSLPWRADANGDYRYERQVNGGRGAIAFFLTKKLNSEASGRLDAVSAQEELARWDVRAACLHLIFAAYAMGLDQPWEQEFTVNDRQIETYLGLEKRKDLSKLAKLTLIKDLVLPPCNLQFSLRWLQQGKVPGFTLEHSHLWHLLEIQHHFQEDALGCKHLTGLTFRLKAGEWTKYFLNQRGAKAGTAFYQYSSLPKSLLDTITSIWQQHEGAARMMLWLLFKTKMGNEQRLTIPTLMRIAYGEGRVIHAATHREDRKRLLRSFESDLESLHHYGLKPIFDPATYPEEIQPLWTKLAALPDDAEEALDFWINDGSSANRLTDAAPRDKWHRLMQARLLCFELPPGWEVRSKKLTKPSRKFDRKESIQQKSLSGSQIIAARKRHQLSQRELANRIGKSQSWVRDIESGRLRVSAKDQQLLQTILEVI